MSLFESTLDKTDGQTCIDELRIIYTPLAPSPIAVRTYILVDIMLYYSRVDGHLFIDLRLVR